MNSMAGISTRSAPLMALLMLSSAAAFFLFGSQVSAQNTRYRASNDVLFYEACSDIDGGGSGQSDNDSNLGKVYVLGDSITLGAKDLYEKKLKEAGANSVLVSASGGGNIEAPGTNGTKKSGLEAIASDKDFIKSADTVIIAHGTNQMKHAGSGPNYVAGQQESIKKAIKAVEDTGSNAKIFWVDVAISSRAGSNVTSYAGTINQAIYGAQSEGYSVISWAKAVDSDYDPENATGPVAHNNELLSGDGIHLTSEGNEKLVETVISGVKSGSTTIGGRGSTGDDGSCCRQSSMSLSGDNNIEIAMGYLIGLGFSGAQAAGIVGNMMLESGPDVDPAATNHLDCRGIVQWCFGRQAVMLKYDSGHEWDTMEHQLDFLATELGLGGDKSHPSYSTEDAVVDALKAIKGHTANDAAEAASEFDRIFERSGRDGVPKRMEFAREVFEKYGGAAGFTPGSSSGGNCGETPSGDFVYYSQSDPEYQGKTPHDMAFAGCGPTSLAMIVATQKDKEVDPVVMAEFLGNKHWPGLMLWSAPAAAGEKWNIPTDQSEPDIGKIKQTLKKGGHVILSGTGSPPFTSGGHIIVARELSPDGKIVIANPAGNLATDKPEYTAYEDSEISGAGLRQIFPMGGK